MADDRLRRLARLLVGYSTEVQHSDRVLLHGTVESEPLIRELYAAVLRVGAHPHVRLEFREQEYLLLTAGQGHQLDYVDPFAQREVEEMDVVIRVFPDLNPHALTSVEPARKQRRARALGPYRGVMLDRAAAGDLRMVIAPCPTAALAQEAHMAEAEYAEFVFRCCGLDERNPEAYWRDVEARQQRICDRLGGVSELRFVNRDTDLTVRCDGRRWVNCCGKLNMPDGEVFTGPLEDSAEGRIRFSYPGVYQGEAIEDILLEFEHGTVVDARAARGQALLDTVLETDPGARRVGEIAIGTNGHVQRFTRNMLFDEKMGGTIHLALGASIPESGGLNRSAIHWDLLAEMADGGEVRADGEVIYRDGAFVEGW